MWFQELLEPLSACLCHPAAVRRRLRNIQRPAPTRGQKMLSQKILRLSACCWLAQLCVALPLLADDPPSKESKEKEPASKPISYYQQIRPILVEHCQGCHQPAKADGK